MLMQYANVTEGARAHRYFEPAGRDLAAIDIERFVSAEKIAAV
jgi:hypothetical protein